MPQFPLCSEFIPLLDAVRNQLAELKNLSREFLSSGDEETKREAFLKGQEIEKTKQQMVELKEQPVEFEGNQIPRIDKELLVFFRKRLGKDLRYSEDKEVVATISIERSTKSAVVLEECLKYLKFFVGLRGLWCRDTQITALPETLPDGLEELDCGRTQIIALPETLPNGLRGLDCRYTQITALPKMLPAGLQRLYCYDIPAIKNPETIKQLEEFKKNHPGFEYKI